MDCFSNFWTKQSPSEPLVSPWYVPLEENSENSTKIQPRCDQIAQQTLKLCDFYEKTNHDKCIEAFINKPVELLINNMDDLREIIKNKAERHHKYYQELTETYFPDEATSDNPSEMAPHISDDSTTLNSSETVPETGSTGALGVQSDVHKRQRRQGVYELCKGVSFKSVKQLKNNYLAMLEKTAEKLQSKIKSTGELDSAKDCLLCPPTSGYCSSCASNNSDDERFEKATNVKRYGSRDSAVGQSDEEVTISSNWGEKNELYDDYRPIESPYSPRGSIDHSNVPSRTLIEAKFVPIYPSDRKFSCDTVSVSDIDPSDSRRESCVTDDGDDTTRYRYWRTPSVVVSDYSDDIMGLTLEDLEYIRNRKETCSSADSSLHSSCSNLNYCGSTISSLDAEYILSKPFRKSSECSSCSTLSDTEDVEGYGSNPMKKEVSENILFATHHIHKICPEKSGK